MIPWFVSEAALFGCGEYEVLRDLSVTLYQSTAH
jgi:hypothetical protein